MGQEIMLRTKIYFYFSDFKNVIFWNNASTSTCAVLCSHNVCPEKLYIKKIDFNDFDQILLKRPQKNIVKIDSTNFVWI